MYVLKLNIDNKTEITKCNNIQPLVDLTHLRLTTLTSKNDKIKWFNLSGTEYSKQISKFAIIVNNKRKETNNYGIILYNPSKLEVNLIGCLVNFKIFNTNGIGRIINIDNHLGFANIIHYTVKAYDGNKQIFIKAPRQSFKKIITI